MGESRDIGETLEISWETGEISGETVEISGETVQWRDISRADWKCAAVNCYIYIYMCVYVLLHPVRRLESVLLLPYVPN